MNILTFDIEEWYLKKVRNLFQDDDYHTFDSYLSRILDLLDERQIKATFFCVGGLAREYPEVVKTIFGRGHEIGCHSDEHIWLSNMSRDDLMEDTQKAISSLEDVVGQKVVSFRAPAFSIGEQNKWAMEVLAECGIEMDSSIFPAVRDYGGFDTFPVDRPCIVKVGSKTIKEFPIPIVTLFGRPMAYSGGGYFRFFPKIFLNKIINSSDYLMMYFHIGDLIYRPYKLMNKEQFEEYFKTPGTLTNRMIRMFKTSFGTKGAFSKMSDLIWNLEFENIYSADKIIEWDEAKEIEI